MTSSEIAVPGEWAQQSAVWVGWPRLITEWQGQIDAARAEIADFVRELSAFVPVRLAVGDDAAAAVALKLSLNKHAAIRRIPSGDIWLRDTGPVFTRTGNNITAHVFRFNGWGGKYEMDGDRETAGAIATEENVPSIKHDFILEGGAVDFDGTGTVLTTAECALNPNRNGKTSRTKTEAHLAKALGAKRAIWVKRGLLNDHTDGHIDNIVRFIAPGHVVCQTPSGTDDPHAERLAEIEDTVRAAGLTITLIPSPGIITDTAENVLPASHMNFFITNGAVIVPIYEDTHSHAAVSALAAVMPNHRIIPLSARHICAGGGGAFHCMTCNVPAPGGS